MAEEFGCGVNELPLSLVLSWFEQKAIVILLTLLTAAEGIEKYLHTKYVGQKRFSLEGGETLIPLLDELIQHGGSSGINEVVIGMSYNFV